MLMDVLTRTTGDAAKVLQFAVAGGAVGTGGRSKQPKSGAVGKFITRVSVTIPDRNESFQSTVPV